MATHTISELYNYTVDVVAKKSITVTREGETPNRFEIGDYAEYDAFNLTYVGKIIKITEKTVTIEYDSECLNPKKRRLSLYEFAWRNWNFNEAEVYNRNAETMMNI